jgi:hypothetical protein
VSGGPFPRLEIRKEAALGELIHFPSPGERHVHQQLKNRGLPYRSPRTHSGRVLEGKLLGLLNAGKRQKPRFNRLSR